MANRIPQGRCYLRLNVAIGSFVESDDEQGMAHFIEHLAFDDRAVSKGESLAEWLQKNGMSIGADANASTSAESTVYKLDLPTCDQTAIESGLKILRSFADGLKFNEAAIARERNIIDAEERENENMSGDVSKMLIEHLYSGTLFASRPVIGKKDIRSRFNKEMIEAFYKKWYRAKNISVVLVGDYQGLDPAVLISNAFHSMDDDKNPAVAVERGTPDHQRRAFIINNKEISHVDAVYAIQTKNLDRPSFKRSVYKDRIAFQLAIDMVSNAFAKESERLTKHLRNPAIGGFMYDRGRYELSLSISATKENYEEAFLEAFNILMTKARFGFDPSEFDIAKTGVVESLDRSVTDEQNLHSGYWSETIVDHINQRVFAQGAAARRHLVRSALAEIDMEDCRQAVIDAIDSGNEHIFALGLLADDERNVDALKALLKRAKTANISPPRTAKKISFRYGVSDDQRVGIKDQRTIENINTQKIALDNNINILLKTTDFKTDDIWLTISTDQGYSTMNQRDSLLMKLARAVLPGGGLNLHPPEEIPDLCADKHMRTWLDVFGDHIQVTSHTGKKDLRFVLEYLRAFITDPMYSEATLAREKEKAKISNEELKHNLWAPLNHDFLKELTDNDHRVGRGDLEGILAISRAELIDWHKRFIGDRPLNIVVVGDFDMAKTTGDLLSVFGSLPKRSSAEKPKVSKLAFKVGINKTYQVDAKDVTSKLYIRYPLNFPSTSQPDHRLAILQNVVQEALRKKLREKRQLTYSPSVHAYNNGESFLQNWFEISISAQPDQASMVLDDVKKILKKLATAGVRSDDLVKAKEPYLAMMGERVLENHYWAMVLSKNFTDLNSMIWINNLRADITNISAQDINLLLRKYFNEKSASTAIVNGNKA